MKKIIFTFALALTVSSLFAQTEKATDRAVAAQFERHYNQGQFEQIFQLFAPEMRQALPLAKTQEFLQGLTVHAGTIKQRDFLGYEATYASYDTHFERARFAVNISVDANGKINGLLVKPLAAPANPAPSRRNTTSLALPVKGAWTVFWGGDTQEQNYHVQNPAQRHAFDMVVMDKAGKTHTADGTKNTQYYAFGKDLLAPCNGEVVQVVTGVKDNLPGQMNPAQRFGNTLVLKTAQEEYLVLAHFKEGSLKIKPGQKVKKGQVLGQCGNSGNSSEPHLHVHLQDTPDLTQGQGIKMFFENLMVNGKPQSDYSPVKGDLIHLP